MSNDNVRGLKGIGKRKLRAMGHLAAHILLSWEDKMAIRVCVGRLFDLQLQRTSGE